MYDQEIIEKKPSSPLATSLLGAACLCLIGAMVLQGMMLLRYNEGNDANKGVLTSAEEWSKDTKKLTKEIATIIEGDE